MMSQASILHILGWSCGQPTYSLRYLYFEMGNAAAGYQSNQYYELELRGVAECSVQALYVSQLL